MSASCPGSGTGGDQYLRGELAGVTSSATITVQPGESTLICPPPTVHSNDDLEVTCRTICGARCYSSLPCASGSGSEGGRAMVIRIKPSSVCVNQGQYWMVTNNANGKVFSSCSGDSECGICS